MGRMSRKNRRKQNSQKEKKTNWSKYFLGVGASLLASLLLYLGVNFHYDRKHDQRYNEYYKLAHAYSEELSKEREDPSERWEISEKSSLSFLDKIRYINRLDSMDSGVEEQLPDFLRFVEENTDYLSRVTESPREIYGYVRRSGKNFTLIDLTSYRESLVQYLEEILGGDFRHGGDITSYANITGLFPGIENKDRLAQMIQVLDTCTQYKNLSPEQRSASAPRIKRASGEVDSITPEEFESMCTASRSYFEYVVESTAFISLPIITDDFLRDDMYARFHTHPKDDENYFPSKPDEFNVYLAGPQFLLSRSNGTLRVYTITRRGSRQVYEKVLNY